MTFWGDVQRILQIIINLVSNSLKYTPPHGSVTLVFRRSGEPTPRRLIAGLDSASAQSQRSRTSDMRRSVRGGTANFINPSQNPQLQERSVAPPGNDLYIEFEVRDTGQGIPEDMQDRIFEPFVQGEVGLNRRHSGTGLGLRICSQLASLMKGTISLKSTPGQGSTFTVKIPLRHVMTTPTIKASQDVIRTASRPTSLTNSDKAAFERDTSESGISEKDFIGPSKASVPADLTISVPAGGDARQASEGTARDVHDVITEQPEPGLAAPMQSPQSAQQDPSTNDYTPSISSEHPTSHQKTAKKERKHSRDTKAAEQHNFSRLRVLVAEDNKVDQQVILRMLKMEEILQVTIAEDGQQALDYITTLHGSEPADSPRYDLIFMDIQMPVMDGLTSARLIRETGSQIPICALTAYAEQKTLMIPAKVA